MFPLINGSCPWAVGFVDLLPGHEPVTGAGVTIIHVRIMLKVIGGRLGIRRHGLTCSRGVRDLHIVNIDGIGIEVKPADSEANGSLGGGIGGDVNVSVPGLRAHNISNHVYNVVRVSAVG